MKKIYFTPFFLLLFLVQSSAQPEVVKSVMSFFPYQHGSEAEASLNAMESWDKNNWKTFLSLLNSKDSTQLVKAEYALNAYVNHVMANPEKKKQAAEHLSASLSYIKSFEGRYMVIQHLGLLGEEASVKPLSALLTDHEFAGNAARALASIHSTSSTEALNKALLTAKEPARKHIEAALDNVNKGLPKISRPAQKNETGQNDVQHLLMLQDRMDAARNTFEKRQILAEAGRIPGFPAFMFIGRYLHDSEIREEAALLLARLALLNKDARGKAVRQLLEEALPLIKGEDSAFLVKQLSERLPAIPYDNGFEPAFNGRDLSGWQALVGDPLSRAKMSAAELQNQQKIANEKTKGDWVVKDGLLVFTGHGENLATVEQYGDFEMYVDWKITAQGDAGIYLRGSPQVQIWDTSRRDVGAEVGSGGLYNNEKNPSKPIVVADNKVGEWNNFHIIMKGDKVTVYLNGVLVTDNVALENYWDRKLPIFPREQIELQAHGTYVAYRNIYLKELPAGLGSALSEEERKQGFRVLFDGSNLDQWTGDTSGYRLEEGVITVHPEGRGAGNLFTKEEFTNFEYRFEFQLTPGANNGLGIRAPLEGDAAYVGMELQILDNEAEKYKDLHEYQYHGSVYGVIPAKRGYLLPTGEWNQETVIVKGSRVKVILNGTPILDGDIKTASKKGTADGKDHPGLKRKSGHIGFLGHGDVVRFRNIRIKTL